MRTPHKLAVVILIAVSGAPAATMLGFLTTNGSFQLDRSKIWGTATLFDGSVVETKVSPCRIHLQDGAELQLAPGSKARFFQGGAAIETGALQLRSAGAYRVETRNFRLTADAGKTIATLKLEGAAGLAVSVASGRMLVTNTADALVADVAGGKTVTVTPDPGGTPAMTRITGCVLTARKSVVLVDEASNLTFAVHGHGVETEIGNRVEVVGTGLPPAGGKAGNPPSVEVSQVHLRQKGACPDAMLPHRGMLRTIAARPAATALIGGAMIAGVAGGLEIKGTLASEEPADTSR